MQDSYDRRHAGQPNKVQLNDAVFALHAVFISSVTLSQVLLIEATNLSWAVRERSISCRVCTTSVSRGQARGGSLGALSMTLLTSESFLGRRYSPSRALALALY